MVRQRGHRGIESGVRNTHDPYPAVVACIVFYEPVDRVVGVTRLVYVLRCFFVGDEGADIYETAFAFIGAANILHSNAIAFPDIMFKIRQPKRRPPVLGAIRRTGIGRAEIQDGMWMQRIPWGIK